MFLVLYLKHKGKQMNTEAEIWWWGYLHSNGTPQLKRWFGDHKDYTEDTYDNPFVLKVVPPFVAGTREEAIEILMPKLGFKKVENHE